MNADDLDLPKLKTSEDNALNTEKTEVFSRLDSSEQMALTPENTAIEPIPPVLATPEVITVAPELALEPAPIEVTPSAASLLDEPLLTSPALEAFITKPEEPISAFPAETTPPAATTPQEAIITQPEPVETLLETPAAELANSSESLPVTAPEAMLSIEPEIALLSTPEASAQESTPTPPETITITPETPSTLAPEITAEEPVSQAPLNQKLKVEKPGKLEKEKKGNPLIGFITFLIIIGIIVAAFYYFVTQGIIELPANIKLPFTKATIPVITTTSQLPETGEQSQGNSLSGLYQEKELKVCPETAAALTLNAENTFTFDDVKYDSINATCSVEKNTGTYTTDNGVLTLNISATQSIVAAYTSDNGITSITITGVNNTELNLVKEDAPNANQ